MNLRKFYVGSKKETGRFEGEYEIEITEWEKFGDKDREYIVGVVYTDEEDAALIAAAPEMYEALNELQQLFRDDLAPGYIYACKDVLKNADAALKKARGE